MARYVRVEQKRIQPNPKRSDAQAVAVRTEGDAVLKALAPSVRCPTHHPPHRPPPTVWEPCRQFHVAIHRSGQCLLNLVRVVPSWKRQGHP